MASSGHFRLSISRALTDQLHGHLHTLEPVPLTEAHIADLENRQGVYQLYLQDDLVYVGSAAGSLRNRLSQHREKLAGRERIAATEVRFTCLYVDEDLTVLAPEDRLIRLFQHEGSCVWNGNGFGLHDPGRRRDETTISGGHFDALYPIRLDWICESIERGTHSVRKLLTDLKRELPYTFRYQNDRTARAIYESKTTSVPATALPVEDLFRLLAHALPEFQITALPGYVIMYRESRPYPQGRVIR